LFALVCRTSGRKRDRDLNYKVCYPQRKLDRQSSLGLNYFKTTFSGSRHPFQRASAGTRFTRVTEMMLSAAEIIFFIATSNFPQISCAKILNDDTSHFS